MVSAKPTSEIPTFADYLHKLRKINPDVGIIENDVYYDTGSCSEYELFKWVKSILRYNVASYGRVNPFANKTDIIKIYHGCLCFNDYAFVKKLQTKSVWSSKDIFEEMKIIINNSDIWITYLKFNIIII